MQTRYILLVSAIISVIFSGLATVLPIGNFNQGEVSAMLPTLFTPATYTFSIWSLIYLSWFIIGWLSVAWNIQIQKTNALLLAWAQILSSLWLIPSQFMLTGTSMVVMLWVLYLLIILFYESRTESSLFKIVSDLFLGWIIVASIANLHLTLVAFWIYWTGIVPVLLTVVSLFIGLLVNVYFIKKYKSYTPALVLIWAGIWIIIGQENSIVQLTAIFVVFYTIWLLANQAYSYKRVKK